ncbi:MAG: 3'-5' exonuclease [Mizugakiibacter sp.]|uniref:DEAD/DEAH box helicase n=1 Tax=Mizugakiibacter sp. TaxID=1972610 RepID=UPI0031BFBB56|nr:NERD domain-containing protein [Xanthomonadaceae bacterium]
MGKLIPNRNACLPRMTPGEKRLASRLEDKLDADYLCWYDVPVGPRQRHPDFVVFHPSRGFLILEVKDWKLESIAEMDPNSATLHTERGRAVVANPARQAREYAMEVKTLLERDPALRHPEAHRRAGKLIMPWGWGVVLTNITRAQFDEAQLENFIPQNGVICKDEMAESVDHEEFQKRLWDMFMMPFPCHLTLPQIDRFRWNLFPEIRIPEQGSIFEPPKDGGDALTRIPDLIRVMDLQQEQLARSLGDGHRVIHGVAGSGKTMILGYRCVELAKRYAKPILVLCYNKTLAARLERLVDVHGVSEKVTVAHFHGWCSRQLETYAVPKPRNLGSADDYVEALVSAVIAGVESRAIPRGQYAAVLIDEGHDFEPEWLRLVTQMVDSQSNSLLLLYDDAQSIYDDGARRKFTFASVGIQAQGRTTILRLNYRNSLEVLATAKAFAQEVIAAHDSDEDHIPLIEPESAGRRGPLPELLCCRNSNDEAATIGARIRSAMDDGASPDDFGVLCRFSGSARQVATELVKARIPCTLAEGDAKRQLFAGAPTVKVMTIHSSKGLEFDTVFIPGVCDIAARGPQDSDTILKEAKLLYVGMTRALGRLVMLHHKDGPVPDRIRKAIVDVRQRLEAA